MVSLLNILVYDLYADEKHFDSGSGEATGMGHGYRQFAQKFSCKRMFLKPDIHVYLQVNVKKNCLLIKCIDNMLRQYVPLLHNHSKPLKMVT